MVNLVVDGHTKTLNRAGPSQCGAQCKT